MRRRRRGWLARTGFVCFIATLLIVTAADSASAQARRRARPRRTGPPRAGSVDVGGGIIWSGGFDLGERAADETRNIGEATTSPFPLFTTASKLGSGFGLQGRVGVFLSRSLIAEGGIRYTRATVSIQPSADVEQAASLNATETLSEYIVDGSLVLHLNGLKFGGGRAVPFAAGGAGYLRDVHEGSVLIQTGTEYHAVGGLKLWLGNMRVQHLGIRAEGGVSIHDGGFDFSDGRRTVPIATASLFYVF